MFWGFWGFHCSRACFGVIEGDYQKDLPAVVVPRAAGKFQGFFSFFPDLGFSSYERVCLIWEFSLFYGFLV